MKALKRFLLALVLAAFVVFGAWTDPKTWTSEPLIASDMNTHFRDNLNALKAPTYAQWIVNESSNYATSGTSFAYLDNTNNKGSLTITIPAGSDNRMLVEFRGNVRMTASQSVYFDLEVDGNRIGGGSPTYAEGIAGFAGYTGSNLGAGMMISFRKWIFGLAAGSHTVKLMWKVDGGTATLLAGAGTASGDMGAEFLIMATA